MLERTTRLLRCKAKAKLESLEDGQVDGVVSYSYEIEANGDTVIGITIEYETSILCPTEEEAAYARVMGGVSKTFTDATLEIMSLFVEILDDMELVTNADWQQRMTTSISGMEEQIDSIRALEPIESFQGINEGYLVIANLMDSLTYNGRLLLVAPNDEVILSKVMDSIRSEIPQIPMLLESLFTMLKDFCP